MAVTWQKIYDCVVPTGHCHTGVTARLFGCETFANLATGTDATTAPTDDGGKWRPAQRAYPPPYNFTYVKFGSCRTTAPAPPPPPCLGAGESVTVRWSVYDGACQLSALLWEDGDLADGTNPVSHGTIPGGGVALHDEETNLLTIAITNDQEGPPDQGIALTRAQVAITDRALGPGEFHQMFRDFVEGTTPTRGPGVGLDWQWLRQLPPHYVDRIRPAAAFPVRGHQMADFLDWPLDLVPVQKYTAFAVSGMDFRHAVLMRGKLLDGQGEVVLHWAEQIAVRRDRGDLV